MKKKILLTILLITSIFNMMCQTTVLGTASGNQAVRINENSIVLAMDDYTNPTTNENHLGIVKNFSNNAYNYTLENTSILQKGTGGTMPIVTVFENSVSINENGVFYVYYKNNGYGGNEYFNLVKDGISIQNFINKNPISLTQDFNNLYLSLKENGNITLSKIDNYNYTTWEVYQAGEWINTMLSNNNLIFIRNLNGNLSEINPANGNVINTITADVDDAFQINPNNVLENFDFSDTKLYTENGITNWQYRFWTDIVKGSWKKIGNYTYFVRRNLLYVFDKEMEDVYKIRITTFDSNEEILAFHIYDDTSITYITKLNNVIYAKHFALPVSTVPTLNASANNVVSVHNEQIYHNGNWEASNSFISTVVMNDADIPAQGTAVDQNLVIPPTDYTLLDYNPFIPTINADGYAEFIYYKSSGDLYIRIKVYFQPSSTTNINKQENNQINLGYYNNNSQIFYFNGLIQILKYEVFDINGREIMSSNNELDKIELYNLKKGIYIIKAKDINSNIYQKKIIKN